MLTGLDPIAAAFAPVAMVIGLVAGWLARAGWFRTLPKVVVSGVIITLAVTVVAVPLRTALFGGVTGSGADLFVAWMHSMGQNLVESVAITVIGANLVDKILTAVIVWLLLRQLPFAPRAIFRQWLPCAGPLLVVEQLKRQLAIIHEAQRARGVPLDEGWYQRLRAMPALIIPLTHNSLNDLAIRGAALDMRAFRIHNRRTTLWAPADSPLQRVARYTMILLMLTEFGAWIWLR